MELSLVYLTYRPGSLDMLADSLRNQTLQDYELIIIDDYDVDRREMVRNYLQENGVKVKYIGRSKPKCFPDTPFNLINAWNTGVLASTGDLIVFLQDYTWWPPYSLERWLKHKALFEEKCCITGVAKYWGTEPLNVEKDLTGPISIWRNHWRGSPEQNGWKNPAIWVGDPFEMFYFAVPYQVLVEINGFPECYDCSRDQVTPFVERVKKVGGKLFTDRENVCEMIDHRKWNPSGLWHSLAVNPKGSTTLMERENCFNLSKHKRGEVA